MTFFIKLFLQDPKTTGNIKKGNRPAAKNSTIPARVKIVFRSIIPVIIKITPIKANKGGIM